MIPHLLASRRVLCLVLCGSLSALLAGCAAAHGEPAIVEITPPAPRSLEPEPPAPPRALPSAEEALRRINAHLRASAMGDHSIALEAGGRLVKRDSTDAYEEELFLRDVSEIVYAHEEAWSVPHVARVLIKPGGVTRFRRGDEDWTTSTIPHVSFAFRDKRAAEETIAALRALTKQ